MSDLHILLIFFFNDTATTEIYTLSLHDALPIYPAITGLRSIKPSAPASSAVVRNPFWPDMKSASTPGNAQASIAPMRWLMMADRKSTRLNSSHLVISYAVFCLKKKKTDTIEAAD